MEKKEDKFILNTLEIKEVELVKENWIKTSIFDCFQEVLERSNYPLFQIIIACVLNCLFMINIMLNLDNADQWNFPFISSLKSLLSIFSASIFASSNSRAQRLMLLLFFWLHHTLALFFILQFKIFGNRLKNYGVIYLSFYYTLVDHSFGVFFYSLFSTSLGCPGFNYNSSCLSGLNLALFIISILALFEHIALTFLSVYFTQVNNPVLKFYRNGSSRLYRLIFESERFIYAVFFTLKQNQNTDKQFLVFMSVLSCYKIYERYNTQPFRNFHYHAIIVICESVLDLFVIQVAMLVFLEINIANPISFIIGLICSVMFGVAFQDLIKEKFFKNLGLKSEQNDKFEKELMNYSNLFITTTMNLDKGIVYRKRMENMIYAHRQSCSEIACGCVVFHNYDFKKTQIEKLTDDCFKYWNGRLKVYLQTFANNANFLFQTMFISIYHTNEIISIIINYKRIEAVKKDLSQSFEKSMIK